MIPASISVSDLARDTRGVIARLKRNAGERLIVLRNNQPVAVIASPAALATDAPPGSHATRPLKQEVMRRIDALRSIAKANGARTLRLFGSAARGDERADSDLDFIVELERGRTLLDVVGLRIELEQLFDRPVDVVTEKSLKPRLREAVLRDAVTLLE